MTRQLAPFSFLGTNVFKVTVSANNQTGNLRSIANSAGYSGSGNCVITVNSGVGLWGATFANGWVPGSWPAGAVVRLVIPGYVMGLGGGGGQGGSWFVGGSPGGDGGCAFDATGVSGFTFQIDNTSGAIYGGGGGGGGGGVYETNCPCVGPLYVGGGGGGAGQGAANSGGAPGATNTGATIFPGFGGNSGPGGPGGGGNGGYLAFCCVSSQVSGNGGDGGAVGNPGGGGQTAVGLGYAGGNPGNAIKGNSHIVWLGFGTRVGAIT